VSSLWVPVRADRPAVARVSDRRYLKTRRLRSIGESASVELADEIRRKTGWTHGRTRGEPWCPVVCLPSECGVVSFRVSGSRHDAVARAVIPRPPQPTRSVVPPSLVPRARVADRRPRRHAPPHRARHTTDGRRCSSFLPS
jgi:hypothetical protein